MVQEVQHDPIDAVITWVDGLAPAHLQKRQNFMAKFISAFRPLSTTPRGCAKYGLLSMINHQICRA
jgi:hypothetical protein